MEEFLNSRMNSYIGLILFAGVWCALLFIGIFAKTKAIDRRRIRGAVRVAAGCALWGFWAIFIVRFCAYPFFLAKYEFSHRQTVEITGTVEKVETLDNERILLRIDGADYFLQNAAAWPYNVPEDQLKPGREVRIEAGEKSMFVFEIDLQKDAA